jgi:cysteine desulfurase
MVVVSSIEHPAVAVTAARLGDRVLQLGPGSDGVLDPETFAGALTAETAVVAIVMVQNEIGVVQPIAALVQAIRRVAPGCHIHIDAAQAFGKVAIDVGTLGADSLAIAGHKLHGPKGTGALWLRKGAVLEPLWVGGGQQHGLRGGTQDAPGAAGLGLAAERCVAALPTARARWLELAGGVIASLRGRGIEVRQLVPDQRRAPHILALGFAGVPATAMRTVLASRGVYISTGSACAEVDQKPSAVLTAIGLAAEVGMARLSFAHDTTAAEVVEATAILGDVVTELARKAKP